MPRKARILLPNTPHHIVQRGHNRQVVFTKPGDFQYYLRNLVEWKQMLGIKIYSFCLMTNHIHLVAEPDEDTTSLSKLLKRLAGKQTRFVNKREGRTGTLWEGRFKASPIERDAYLLQCCRYVERNPVTAKMVAKPAEYPWSSYRHRIGEHQLSWLDDFALYESLGNNKSKRIERYRRFVECDHDSEHAFIQRAVQKNQLTGSSMFINKVELFTGIRIEHRDQGRPAGKK